MWICIELLLKLKDYQKSVMNYGNVKVRSKLINQQQFLQFSLLEHLFDYLNLKTTHSALNLYHFYLFACTYRSVLAYSSRIRVRLTYMQVRVYIKLFLEKQYIEEIMSL